MQRALLTRTSQLRNGDKKATKVSVKFYEAQKEVPRMTSSFGKVKR